MNHSPAFFDQQKLLHFNGVYLRDLTVEDFVERCRRWATEDAPAEVVVRFLISQNSPGSLRLCRSGRPRLSEAADLVEFLFVPEFAIEESSFEKAIVKDLEAASILAEAREHLERLRISRPSRLGEKSLSSAKGGDGSWARYRHRSVWRCSGAASACRCSSRLRYLAGSGPSKTRCRDVAASRGIDRGSTPAFWSRRGVAPGWRSDPGLRRGAGRACYDDAAHSGVV